MTRIVSKNNAGMLCINKPRIVSQKPNFMSKMSNEKSIKNKMNIIDKILGAQYTNLLIFRSIHFYFSNLNFDVAIKASPTTPTVILAGIGRIPKNIKTAPVNAKKIPTIN